MVTIFLEIGTSDTTFMGRDRELKRLAFSLYPLLFSFTVPLIDNLPGNCWWRKIQNSEVLFNENISLYHFNGRAIFKAIFNSITLKNFKTEQYSIFLSYTQHIFLQGLGFVKRPVYVRKYDINDFLSMTSFPRYWKWGRAWAHSLHNHIFINICLNIKLKDLRSIFLNNWAGPRTINK